MRTRNGLTLALTIAMMLTTILLVSPSQVNAEATIYEGFDYTVGETLNGKDGGIGFDLAGAWANTRSNPTIASGSLAWGNLLPSANNLHGTEIGRASCRERV